jgi:hypothetical protein
MAGLLAWPGYGQVVHLVSPAARTVVTATAGNLPEFQRDRVAVRDLPRPPSCLGPGDMLAILRTLGLLWLLRQALRLLRILLCVAVLVVLWPVTGAARRNASEPP